jgi:hypothetical protein
MKIQRLSIFIVSVLMLSTVFLTGCEKLGFGNKQSNALGNRPDLDCIIANDFYAVHFSTYLQPSKEDVSEDSKAAFVPFCQQIPRAGKMFFTADLIDRDIRTTPIGIRLVEVEKEDLVDLPFIVEILRNRPECFIIFCDDLSFEASEHSYKALKVVLDGSISSTSDNVLIYATSNRRHLMPESMSENLQTQYEGEEIRPGETTEEKISLSERFGLWLSFYAFDQDEYLRAAEHWLMHYGILEMTPQIRQAALQFALTRGARSGRIAYQFVRDYVGQAALKAASR